ncbi:MAG TPA: hypothetical protein VMW21_00535 [Patescibacteria group bacterium]|nr:hypothetical protein [Patescibacteria group bacterium]
MTTEELKAQIKSLKDNLELQKQELKKISREVIENKNYEDLVDRAEGAFLKKDYLEAFLIQSCIIEGIIKDYAFKKILPLILQNAILEKKFKSFELARLIDELFISGKIEKTLYEKLNIYRKKRNDVIHGLLEYKDKNKLDEELKGVYESGKHMKGFIVDDMSKETKDGLTAVELGAQIETILSQLNDLQ